MRKIFALAAFAALAPLPAASGDASALDVWGDWYTPERDSLVRIADCGDGTPCGTVLWVDPVKGEVTHDENNDDPALKERPIEGITLLSDFEQGSRGWQGGWIYNPENGETYRAKMHRASDDVLRVAGCLGPICKAMDWTRGDSQLADASD
jgi:uncharacterized protein (DUF2147 family)